jgi:hypothetical protein
MTGQPGISPVLRQQLTAARDTINALLGEALPPEFIARHPRSGDHRTLAEQEADSEPLMPCRCGLDHPKTEAMRLDAAQASPDNPYGSFDRGRYDAASEPQDCLQRGPGDRFTCTLLAGHHGYHEAHGTDPLHTWQDGDADFTLTRYDAASPAEVAEGVDKCPSCGSDGREWRGGDPDTDGMLCEDDWHDEPGLCPARWGKPPEEGLCSRPSGHPGIHWTAEGIDWGGDWRTAEPGTKDVTP